MKKSTTVISCPELKWSQPFTIDEPESADEFTERFGVDPLTFALRQIKVNVANVIRGKRRGSKTKEPILDVKELQSAIDAYQVGARAAATPSSVRAIANAAKDMSEEDRSLLAVIAEAAKKDPKLLAQLRKMAPASTPK